MILITQLEQYEDHYVHLCDPIKNNIISDGHFFRIIYSTHDITLNGIYLLIELKNITCEKHYNKYKYSFNVNTHHDIINKIQNIEESLLTKIKFNKKPCFKIYEQFVNGNIKLFTESPSNKNMRVVLKMSGIWENEHNYGLTYKFIHINEDCYPSVLK
jgi:hypothetical protein